VAVLLFRRPSCSRRCSWCLMRHEMDKGGPSLTWDLPHPCSLLCSRQGCAGRGDFATRRCYSAAGIAPCEAMEVARNASPPLDVPLPFWGLLPQGHACGKLAGRGSQRCNKSPWASSVTPQGSMTPWLGEAGPRV
jgi:hypothetical protein